MTKVIIGEDCGNSPKNLFLEQMTVAFAKADIRFILERVTDDFHWEVVGDRLIEGKDSLAIELQKRKEDKIVELTIQHVATHGKTGAVDGKIKRNAGSLQAFCHVYEFQGAKATSIRAMTSYVIEIK